MPINADFFFQKAEQEFLAAQTTKEKIEKLKKMISASPKHKGSENLRAELNKRLVKLKKEAEKEKQKKTRYSLAVKKEGNAQVTILSFTQAGKSSLLSALTNAHPKISEIPFTTQKPEIGTLDLDGIKVQLVELPSKWENKEVFGIAKSSDLILVLITSLDELINLNSILKNENAVNKKIFILNKIDYISEEELKKFDKLSIIKISTTTHQGLEELKKKISEKLELIRIYTKEPGKKPSVLPMVVKKDSTIKEMAEKIRKDFPERIKLSKVWGQSARFPGQVVGLTHVLKDKDIVELYLR